MLKKKITLIATILAVGLFYSCSSGGEEKTENKAEATSSEKVESTPKGGGQASVAAVEGEQKNVLQVAMSMDDFATLVVAVKTAGVEDALVNTGPLTVFAPLNTAFEKLPEGTVETLLKPESKQDLTMILINHVAPSNYPIKQLKKEAKKGRRLYMASGKYLEVENRDGKIFVGGTEILQSVKVSNGWIHVIDDVLVPVEE
jgi:uncharacterized surface protein with fasciclin (FAS1) repeats